MAGALILVVEDDPMQAKLVNVLLEEAGHTVEIAESAEKAADVLQWFLPNLILVDIELPGKDGLELTRELRLNARYSSTPVIALTACTHPADFAKARQAGCNGVISKPIDTAAFTHQVRKYLGGTTGIDPDAASDTGDLLAQMRNSFLAEGIEQCDTILKELKRNPGYGLEKIPRLIHRWIAMSKALGFPGICNYARTVEAALLDDPMNSTGPRSADAGPYMESMRTRFVTATLDDTKLPPALSGALRDLRIGLVNFTQPEVARIRAAAQRAKIDAAIRQVNAAATEAQTAFDALIVNECDSSAATSPDRSRWPVPAVFIGSRFSLESFSKLQSRAHDFILAPWDAEEVLLRAYLLIERTAPPEPAFEMPHAQKRRPRVLIADDDPDLISLVAATLVPAGMDCEIARSGRQALDMVRRHPPDAIVLDVNLFDVDGFEILKKLRANLATDTIPVLMLTARSQGSDIALGIGLGADDYVVKPFEASVLVARLEKIISAARRGLMRR